jgi:hypothetical protein
MEELVSNQENWILVFGDQILSVEASFTYLPNNMDMIIGKLSKVDILKQEAVIGGSTITNGF